MAAIRREVLESWFHDGGGGGGPPISGTDISYLTVVEADKYKIKLICT